VEGLSDAEVSTKLTTDEDTPVVAERAVYFSYGSGWDGGHDTMAVPSPSTTWCFAEGYTGY